MKLTLQHITEGQDEIIIRYREMTDEIASLVSGIRRRGERIAARDGECELLLDPDQVLYLESVDERVYACTADCVARADLTLAAAEERFAHCGFFRCSKSMVINICRIKHLKSIPGSRVDAAMDNGEHVIISRRYVRALRAVLKGESQ